MTGGSTRMLQQVGHTAPTESQQFTTTHSCSSRGSNALHWPPWVTTFTCTHPYTDTYNYTQLSPFKNVCGT